jgi:hypothetical protein
MLDLAISINVDSTGTTVVETNHGARLKAPAWPADCDFQVVAFDPSDRRCEVVWTEQLARDISSALMALGRGGVQGPHIRLVSEAGALRKPSAGLKGSQPRYCEGRRIPPRPQEFRLERGHQPYQTHKTPQVIPRADYP